MVTVDREVERKYVADDAFQLPPLTELMAGTDLRPDPAVSPLAEGEPVQHRLAATYFDTVDLRLASAGVTLRRRTGGEDAGWHLKVPAGTDARSEVRHPLGRSTRTVPAPLQQMVWAQSLGSALRPVAEIVTDRTVRRLVDVTGHVVAEVADDRVTARRLLPTDGAGVAAAPATSCARSRSSSVTSTAWRLSMPASATAVYTRHPAPRSWRRCWAFPRAAQQARATGGNRRSRRRAVKLCLSTSANR